MTDCLKTLDGSISCTVTFVSVLGVAAKLATSVNTPMPIIAEKIITGTIDFDCFLLMAL